MFTGLDSIVLLTIVWHIHKQQKCKRNQKNPKQKYKIYKILLF